MKLYEVTNGYLGKSYVKCFVIAKNKNRAIDLAKEKYKNESSNTCYDLNYYKNLSVKLLCDDTSKEYCSDIRDY